MAITLACEQCGADFSVPPSLANSRFCTRVCYRAHIHAAPENNPRWKGGLIPHTCQHCGKEFFDRANNNRRFCSRACSGAALKGTTRPILSEVAKVRWENWSPEQQREKLQCLNKYAQAKRVPRKEYVCDYCGKRFTRYVPPSQERSRYFCNTKCGAASVHRSGEDNPNWRGGLSFEPYPVAFNGSLKTKVRTRDVTCQLCGITADETREALHVHHIDYTKDNCHISNLVALCRVCHCTVNGNRDHWTGFFHNQLSQLYGYGYEMQPVRIGGGAQ